MPRIPAAAVRLGRTLPLPWGLLGMCLLAAGVEHEVARSRLQFAPPVAAVFEFAGKAAEREAVASPVLCLGDSLIKDGVLPRVIEERTGLKSYNLGITGASPAYAYFVLRRALAAGARPAAVFVNVKGYRLSIRPLGNWRGMMQFARPAECLELAWDSQDPEVVAQWLLGRLSPTYRDRDDIRAAVLAALRGKKHSQAGTVIAHQRNWRLNRGAQVLPKNPAATSVEEFWDEKLALDTAWVPNPGNVTYLKKFLATAAAHRVPVYLVVFPFVPRVQRKREALGLEARYDRVVVDEALRFPNVTVVDARRMDLNPADFADASHLDLDGATAFSHALADVLLAGPPAPGVRTVRLTPSRVPARVAARPEDMKQSHDAIWGVPTVRR